MDSFDIDKLLDELELNEGQKAAATPATVASIPSAVKSVQLPQLVTSRTTTPSTETTAVLHPNHGHFVAAGGEAKAASSSSSFKNVFSSLNDYVNAGLEINAPPSVTTNGDGEVADRTVFAKCAESVDEEKSFLLNEGTKADEYDSDEVSDDSGRIKRRPTLRNSSSSTDSSSTDRSTSPSSTSIEYENQTFNDNNTHSFSEFSEKPVPMAELDSTTTATVDEGVPLADVPTTNTFSTETINLEEISSLSSIVEITSNYNNNMKADSTMDEPPQQRPTVGQYVAVDPVDSQEGAPEVGHKRQVVGFESTMDDVSDTELESYLQDLEYEASEKQDVALKSTECENVISKRETTVVVEEDDQLSQASTVEVNDSKMHEVSNQGVDPTPDSVVEEEAVKEMPLKEPNMDVVAPELEEAVNAGAEAKVEISSSDEAVEKDGAAAVPEVPVDEAVEGNKPQLQRPNSLDLNTSKPASGQPQSSPGHTPPSNSLPPPMDSETTSSSEDFSASIAIPEEANEDTGARSLEVS
jgi:hypothetical protein